jgi:hypothetical protein
VHTVNNVHYMHQAPLSANGRSYMSQVYFPGLPPIPPTR